MDNYEEELRIILDEATQISDMEKEHENTL